MDEGACARRQGGLLDFGSDVARGQRHRQIGTDFARGLQYVHARVAGHVVVGHQQVVALRFGTQGGGGLVRVGEAADFVAPAAQQALH